MKRFLASESTSLPTEELANMIQEPSKKRSDEQSGSTRLQDIRDLQLPTEELTRKAESNGPFQPSERPDWDHYTQSSWIRLFILFFFLTLAGISITIIILPLRNIDLMEYLYPRGPFWRFLLFDFCLSIYLAILISITCEKYRRKDGNLVLNICFKPLLYIGAISFIVVPLIFPRDYFDFFNQTYVLAGFVIIYMIVCLVEISSGKRSLPL